MQDMGIIPVFVSVVESGSFSQAAERLGITKSAVSKRISGLEARLGVKLLHRTTRKLSLTEAGKFYLEHAHNALQAAQDAESAVLKLQEEPRGRLRASVPMSFGRLHISPIIPEFLERYPGVELELSLEDTWADIIGEGLDVAVRAGPLSDSSFIARQLTPLNSAVCASPEYIKSKGQPVVPGDLMHHDCLLYSYHTVVNEWVFARDDMGEAVRVKGRYQVNNSEALLDAVLSGIGIGRLPTFIAGRHIESGQLLELLPDYIMPSRMLYAIFPARQYLPAKVRVFLDFLTEKFGADVAYWDRWKGKG